MGPLVWNILYVTLNKNSVKDILPTNNTVIYTNPSDVLTHIKNMLLQFPTDKIKYIIPENSLNIGSILYMKPGDHKIICEYHDNDNCTNNCKDNCCNNIHSVFLMAYEIKN